MSQYPPEGSPPNPPQTPLPLGLQIFYGVKAYQGEYTKIPLLTDMSHSAGWL